jgi:hypothetical protein
MNDRTPHEIARPIVTYMIQELIRNGYTPAYTSDGEEREQVKSGDEALDIVFSVDESAICFRGHGKNHWVDLITCNGEDCIHDWGVDEEFDGVMKKILKSLEHFRCPRCAAVFPESEAILQTEAVMQPGLATIHLGSLACAGCESDDIVPCKAAPQET